MKKVKIGNKLVGIGEPSIISFEPSSTYSTLDEAKKMIEASSKAGANAVKFQTFVTGEADRIMGKKDISIDFGTPTGKKQEKVYDNLKRKELTKDQWCELVEFTRKLDMLFITSVYFPETVDFLKELNVDAIKVSKGDVNNVLLVDAISKTQLPVILDARERFDLVKKDIEICEQNGNEKIIIMHCPSGYPVENSGVHLNAIGEILKRFEYPVGFADHSLGGIMNFAAIPLGVSMLEITITPDKSIEHVEHYMSLELDELKKFVNDIRSIEAAMGNASILTKSRVEEDARRSFVTKKDVKKGDTISVNVLDYRRPGNMGIPVSEGFEILKKKAKMDIPNGTILQWDMLE